MSPKPDKRYDVQFARVAELLAELERFDADQRLEALRKAALHCGGRADLPAHDATIYDPLVKSIEVFGVYAMAEELDELACNWMRAASNIMDAERSANLGDVAC